MGLIRSIALFIVVALTLPGCALLTADIGLIETSSDAFAVEPGVWALSNASPCEGEARQPSSQRCLEFVRIDRSAEGAWRVSQVSPGKAERITFKVALAGKRFFVAESAPNPSDARYYLVLRPHRGEAAPFHRLGVAVVDCQGLLNRSGQAPVGVRLEHKDGKLNGCKADNLTALVAAARLSAQSNQADLRKQQAVYVRP